MAAKSRKKAVHAKVAKSMARRKGISKKTAAKFARHAAKKC